MDLTCPNPLYRIDQEDPCFRLLPHTFQFTVRNKGVFVSLKEMEYLIENFKFTERNFQKIRCGQCLNCRLNKSREWAVRCVHESMYHKHNYFLTLTYNDSFLPSFECIDYDGSIVNSSLYQKDMQDFFKRYRKFETDTYGSTNLRTLYCGEYGPKTNRPHYHALVFGAHELTDLQVYSVKDGIVHYTSQTVQDRWSYYDRSLQQYIPMGFVTISDVNFLSAAYVSKYCMKKIIGQQKSDFMDYYKTLDNPPPLRQQEFLGMSRRPGIGYQYYKDHKDDIYEADSVIYTNQFKAISAKPPKYYDKLFDVDDPESSEKVKSARKDLSLIKSHLHSETAEAVSRKSLERNTRAFDKRSCKL